MNEVLEKHLRDYYSITMNHVSSGTEQSSKLKKVERLIVLHGKHAIKSVAKGMAKSKSETMLFTLWLEMVALSGRV